ncbi:hybrid sensor histidine kinase/response regulator [Marinobacterium nitratireducens]|uniref:histidine kinase n=1 Tax=Marinobacterium nitratireducens TaxID=518897 RepID=A0A917Z5D7_9GAMM|nr:PAS domain-containing hybrid sensor histidine kinase/response regulator [Marinobacterium nitratireducens]GGO75580.1 hybrid sensor histidine kinase/response regulator [Marinobacterium nitratireducens]
MAGADTLSEDEVRSLRAQVEALERDNQKLRKINRALIERVESGGGHRADPYAAFEHSVVLAEQVRERTEALNSALSQLKRSNRALTQANEQAEMSQQRLFDAIESISDAFVLFDSGRRILLFNSRFRAFWNGTGVSIEPGTTIQDLTRLAREQGLVVEESGGDSPVMKLASGRWIQISERGTRDGGLVVLYTDITELKAFEEARRERALAQKSRLLQGLVDQLSQGVALVTADGELEVWNRRFIELGGVDPGPAPATGHADRLLAPVGPIDTVQARETKLPDGRVLEIRTHPMPTGGYVNTYTDITERHRYAETLRESEQWIRLITDHVPALIGYVGEDLRYQFTNKVYDEWYGWPRGGLNGRLINEVQGEAQFQKIKPYMDRALAGESVTFEIDEKNLHGELRCMLKSYVPNLDSNGHAVGIFVMIRDITERRRTAHALEQAYQHLEQRVRERTAELTALNDQLRQEIQERAAIEARLREAKKEAEQANLSKTKFLAAVSHDLLQPLNAARLFTGALQEQSVAEPVSRLVASVSNSLADVESLLSTLVDISKLDAGVIRPDINAFCVRALLENIANEYRQVASNQGLELHFVSSGAVIESDSQLLARILRNFLSNALRYTEHGRILFGCRRRRHSLVIEVWDTGIGIPEEKLTEIFLEFRRIAPPSGAPHDKGLGLGLAIVDKISRILGHQVAVTSVEGRGSVFSVEVPLGKLRLMPQADTQAAAVTESWLLGARLWVVDNDRAICEGMATLLRGWGCEVVTALSLADLERQQNVARGAVDLLIVDYHLDDDENGVDLVAAIRAQRRDRLPVLMVTANYSHELKQQIRDLGYLLMHKPVKPMKLKTTLNHLLNGNVKR